MVTDIAIAVSIVTVIVAIVACFIRYMDRKIRHGNELRMQCTVCTKILWVNRTQLASWVLGGMHGEGRCDCGNGLRSLYLGHQFTQKIISNAYSQVFRNEAADDTIKAIRGNLELANRIRLPEVVRE